MTGEKLYHGGKRGLDIGDMLVPSPPHVSDGCPICVARAEGRTFTVGEFRRWMKSVGGPQAERALFQLGDADDSEPMDPPTKEDAVYITSDYDYALWYAARSQGDMYLVRPVGEMSVSSQDHFPTWTVPKARIIGVVGRKIRLRDRERRRLMRRWQAADIAASVSSSAPARPDTTENT